MAPALLEFIFKTLGLTYESVYFVACLALVAGLAIVYRLSLAPMGEMLHRREFRILEIVTHELE